MNFDYLIKIEKESSIDIENIGNCAIDAYNDLGFEWLFLVCTIEGTTHMIEFGPVVPDLDILPAKVSYTYDRIDFKEGKIANRISKFLNEPSRNITQVFEITQQEAREKMRNLVDCI